MGTSRTGRTASPSLRLTVPTRAALSARNDSGAAPVEFVLVGTLLLFLFLGVIQVGLFLHIRNTLAADAAEGARYAANLNVDVTEGGPYARRLVASTVPGRSEASCESALEVGELDVTLVAVRCEVEVPLSLVPLGASRRIEVVGHAVKELP